MRENRKKSTERASGLCGAEGVRQIVREKAVKTPLKIPDGLKEPPRSRTFCPVSAHDDGRTGEKESAGVIDRTRVS